MTKEATSGSLAARNLPTKGRFVVKDRVDQRDNCDVNHQWWVEVEDDQGNEYESTEGPAETWPNDVASGEYTVRVTEPKK